MRKWKRRIAVMLMLAVLATFVPVTNVEAKGPAKLGTKDFVYTTFKGKKEDFLKISKKEDTYYNCYYQIIDNKNVKGTGSKKFKTNRKIKLGSKEADVKKKYGKAPKVTVNKKEKWYKAMNYGQCGMDMSAWKSYLEYNYAQNKDKYKIRFYLDKKKKVTAVVYIKNLNKFYNYPNKEAKPGLTFQAPKGKKITTKTINGKKVYMLPRGTKFKLKKATQGLGIIMFDVYGKEMGYADGSYYYWYSEEGKTPWEYNTKKSLDLEKIINKYMEGTKKKINTKKLGKYLYFALYCDDCYDGNGTERNVAPAIYYFKFK